MALSRRDIRHALLLPANLGQFDKLIGKVDEALTKARRAL
jgi:hypothetical protein